MITVKSDAFAAGDRIPRKYAREGDDVSPPLSWSGAPDKTREFALLCDDPDAPRAEPWVHWVAYKIPAGRTSFAEGNAGGIREGKNDYGDMGYGGPMPPPGHGVHHYHFKVFALDASLELQSGATKKDLLGAIKGHVLDQGELIGTYERK